MSNTQSDESQRFTVNIGVCQKFTGNNGLFSRLTVNKGV